VEKKDRAGGTWRGNQENREGVSSRATDKTLNNRRIKREGQVWGAKEGESFFAGKSTRLTPLGGIRGSKSRKSGSTLRQRGEGALENLLRTREEGRGNRVRSS